LYRTPFRGQGVKTRLGRTNSIFELDNPGTLELWNSGTLELWNIETLKQGTRTEAKPSSPKANKKQKKYCEVLLVKCP